MTPLTYDTKNTGNRLYVKTPKEICRKSHDAFMKLISTLNEVYSNKEDYLPRVPTEPPNV